MDTSVTDPVNILREVHHHRVCRSSSHDRVDQRAKVESAERADQRVMQMQNNIMLLCSYACNISNKSGPWVLFKSREGPG